MRGRSHEVVRSGVSAMAVLLAACLTSIDARAAEDTPSEQADGSTDCRALRARNDQELALYEKRQPPSAYKYPQNETIINAPWGDFFKGVANSGGLLLSTILPHVGAQSRAGAPSVLLSWSWSVLVIGPMYSCTRKYGTYLVDGHRAHRFLVEPGVNSGGTGTGFHVRGGYRFIWHPTSWVVGPGLGLGSTVEVVGNREPFRYSVSPEVVAHFGNCCSSSYFTLSVRYDHFFKGTSRDIIGGTLGYTFF